MSRSFSFRETFPQMNHHMERFFSYESLFFQYDAKMTQNMKNDKIDKRAAALRDNLKRRKAKTKAEKTQNKESKDGTTKSK